MDSFVREQVMSCGRCIRRKTNISKCEEVVNITSTSSMEIMCLDFLSLERSKELSRIFSLLPFTFLGMHRLFSKRIKQLGLQLECFLTTLLSIMACRRESTSTKGKSSSQNLLRRCVGSQRLRNDGQHLIILWVMVRLIGSTKRSYRC